MVIHELAHGVAALALTRVAGAWEATIGFLVTAVPVHYGAGLGGWGESDGRVVLRVLLGGPPGGIAREVERLRKPERAVRPAFLVVAIALCILSLLVDPVAGLLLVVVLGCSSAAAAEAVGCR